MRYILKDNSRDAAEYAVLREALETILQGLGLELLELSISRHKSRKGAPSSVQVRVALYKKGPVGLNDCSRAHHALLPRLELAFPEQDLFMEVSSPGIDRLIKDGRECAHYLGRGLRCYCADTADWTTGILEAADETGIVLKGAAGALHLNYETIAKAKLDPACP